MPYDQGLEHGPRDFFANPDASDPKYILELAKEGGFNGIAIQIGLAEKFYWDYAGEIPLVLKLNGKTDIPSAIDPLSPVNATVQDAVRLGADAVGYTLYVGTPAQEPDFAHYRQVAIDAVVRSGQPHAAAGVRRGAGWGRGDAGEGPPVDGGGRDRPDLRPQRLAARAQRVTALRRPGPGHPGQVPSG